MFGLYKKFILVLFALIILFVIFYILSKSGVDSGAETLKQINRDILGLQTKLNLLSRHLYNDNIKKHIETLPVLYLITPTYTRYTQQADLIRMSNTLKHVLNIHWIVIEDSDKSSELVADLLKHSGLNYTHLHTRTQKDLISQKKDPRWKKHRGVDQRNEGLMWIRKNLNLYKNAVVYFADDDNTYHLDLFNEMRWTKKVSMWPVALVGGLRWEGPVCKNGKVLDFFTGWMPSRKFPVDMAAFAINVKLLFQYSTAYINPEVKRGLLETDFLEQLHISIDDLEAKSSDCSKILVWHTQTSEPKMKEEKRLALLGKGSDPRIII